MSSGTRAYWQQPPTVIAIDTSCDDTSAAVVRGTAVLSNVISSQYAIHQHWGGVVPNLAKRAHQERIDAVVQEALRRAKTALSTVDAIAVTYGPGLAVALEVGVAKAKMLSSEYGIPLVAVNHMEGHLLANLANIADEQLVIQQFPVLALLVSGGHTELVRMNAIGEYVLLGKTLDDAVGEAFDKTARLLGLGYPGGLLLAQKAVKGNADAYHFPLPMTRQKNNLNFSFSGLKAAVSRQVAELTKMERSLRPNEVVDIAASFQKVAVQHLVRRTTEALQQQTDIRELWLGGGVSANALLRRQMKKVARQYAVGFRYPIEKELCMDNAAMIGIAGMFRLQRGKVVSSGTRLDRDPVLELGV